jgi:hypothetical protein
MATVSRKFNKVALAEAAWSRVAALKVARVDRATGGLRATTVDGRSRTALFSNMRELVEFLFIQTNLFLIAGIEILIGTGAES